MNKDKWDLVSFLSKVNMSGTINWLLIKYALSFSEKGKELLTTLTYYLFIHEEYKVYHKSEYTPTLQKIYKGHAKRPDFLITKDNKKYEGIYINEFSAWNENYVIKIVYSIGHLHINSKNKEENDWFIYHETTHNCKVVNTDILNIQFFEWLKKFKN